MSRTGKSRQKTNWGRRGWGSGVRVLGGNQDGASFEGDGDVLELRWLHSALSGLHAAELCTFRW